MESNEQLSKLYELQRQAYLQAPYPSYDDRIAALDKLKAILKEHKHGIAKAIAEDFGHRAHPETLVLEVFPSLQCIDYYKKKSKKMDEATKAKCLDLVPAS